MKPNVLFIVTDQLRFDCIGFANAYPVKTPNLDRLFRSGVSFTHAYTNIPLCCPARQTLLTGRRNETFGSLWNYDLTLHSAALEPEEFSCPRELQAVGYSTGYLGKWHVHPTYSPLNYGYEDYVPDTLHVDFLAQQGVSVQYHNGWFGEADPLDLSQAHTHWLANQAIEMMDTYAERGKPWHIRLDFQEPHLPCRPTQGALRLYQPECIPPWHNFNEDFRNKPYIQRQQLLNWNIQDFTWADWSPIVARYYAMITQVDDAVGRVLHHLEDSGLSDDTIVVFTSDHGDMCGAHRMMDKHYVMYDDVVRVPLVVSYPAGQWVQGERQEFVYNTLDIQPTLFELLGIPIPNHFVGRSLLPLLEGRAEVPWRQEVVSTYNGQQFGLYTQRMIRTAKWKYVWNTTDVDEVYDMETDPGELRNLIDVINPDVLSALRDRLHDILIAEGDRLPKNPWMKHQLVAGNKLPG